MNLFQQTKNLWTKERAELAARWAEELEAGVSRIVEASALFNEPSGLRFYVTVGNVSEAGRGEGGSLRFSVRHRGQEVATLSVGAQPKLVITPAHAAANEGYFKVNTPPGWFLWNSPKAREFRKLFKASKPGARVKSEEREHEARILKQLEATSARLKFGNTLRGVRHCGLTKHEYPVQYPVPISANTGTPRLSRGNIDILVRQQRDGRTRLAVWELKRPGALQHALAQAYIYAVTLAMTARGAQGGTWFRLFGFPRGVPEQLEIDAVAMVSKDQRRKVPAALAELSDSPLVLPELNARIGLHTALYDPATLKIEWLDLWQSHMERTQPTRIRA